MRKIIVSFLLGGVLGELAGFAVGLFYYPFIFLSDIVAQEQLGNVEAKTLIAKGEFIHANPSDPIHYGRGTVNVFADVVHLGDNFEIGPGPAFHVYLVPEQQVIPDTDVAASMFVDLGRLRAFKGSQVYSIPDGVAWISILTSLSGVNILGC